MIEMEPPPFRGVANCMGPKSESTDLKRQWKPQDPAGLAVHPQFFCRYPLLSFVLYSPIAV